MAKDNKLIGLVLGQYEIVELVGKGGMATVYRGVQKGLKRTVAIKVLPRNFTHDDTFMARFQREADLVAQLEHPHIMPIYDYGEYDDMPYIVMRYVDGGSLHERIRANDLSFDEIIRITMQIASALDYAHSNGVLHRDVKPSNMMLDARGNAYLTDFGLARLGESSAGSLTGSNIVGTPAYIAPEQAEQGPQAPTMDIYSLGVSVFEMLTGQIPYIADTPIAQILAHVQRPVPSIRMVKPDVPAEADLVVKKAMSKRPENRYQSASQFAMALEAALTGAAAEDIGFEESLTPALLESPDVDFAVVPEPHTEPMTPKPATPPTIPAPILAPVPVVEGTGPLPAAPRTEVISRSEPLKPWRGRLLAILVVVAVIIGIAVVLNGVINGGTQVAEATDTAPAPTRDRSTATNSESEAGVGDETETPTLTEEPTNTASPTETDTPETEEATDSPTDEPTPTEPAQPTSIPQVILQRAIEMVLVPEGIFIMGSRVGQQDEAPEHQVHLDNYYIDRHEVKITDYKVCVAEGACIDPTVLRSRTRSRYYDLEQYAEYPLINVTWEEAQDYCHWRGGHLPTEAQWEKAASWDPVRQAPRAFPWGSALDAFYLNYGATAIGDTTEVNSYPQGRSAYGIADMSGNVAEWVFDWYASNFYGVSPFANPIGPTEGTQRVYRGGNYASFGAELRPSARQRMAPDQRSDKVGFRCAQTPGGDPTKEE